MGFVRNSVDHIAALRQRIPGVAIKSTSVDHSYAELNDIAKQISDDMTSLCSEGIQLWAVGVEERVNRVVLRLDENRPEWLARLRHRYGSETLKFEFGGPPVIGGPRR